MGLKKNSRLDHEKFDQVLLNDGFKTNVSDKCLYFKHIGSSRVIICLYIDDMLIFGINLNSVENTKKFQCSKLDMKDMGEADVILGIKIHKHYEGIILS